MSTVNVLVPVSGGKDSQASLALALAHHPKEHVRGLFCDTQFEHPITYQHLDYMRELYGVRIDTVTAGSVEEKCRKHKRFPGGGARHCTDELKIIPTKKYCKALAEEQGRGFEVWYGMRTEESHERKKRYAGKVCDEVYAPHEVLPRKYPKYLAKMGVSFRLCVLDWTEREVIDYVGWWKLNPLYWFGFPRVGCFPCQASGDVFKEMAYQFDDFGADQYRKVIRISQEIGKPVWNSKGGAARNAEKDRVTCALVCGG